MIPGSGTPTAGRLRRRRLRDPASAPRRPVAAGRAPGPAGPLGRPAGSAAAAGRDPGRPWPWRRPAAGRAARAPCGSSAAAASPTTRPSAPVPDAAIRQRRDGIRVLTADLGVSVRRPPWSLSGAKTLSYAENLAARRWASAQGADDLIWLSTEGHVLEAPTASVVWLPGDTLHTVPAAETGILPGTTAAHLLAERGPAAARKPLISRDELAAADAIWLTSSLRGLAEVRSLDGQLPRAVTVDGPPAGAAGSLAADAEQARGQVRLELRGPGRPSPGRRAGRRRRCRTADARRSPPWPWRVRTIASVSISRRVVPITRPRYSSMTPVGVIMVASMSSVARPWSSVTGRQKPISRSALRTGLESSSRIQARDSYVQERPPVVADHAPPARSRSPPTPGYPPWPRPRHSPMNGSSPSSAGCRSGPVRRSYVSSYGYGSTGGAFSQGGGPSGFSVSLLTNAPSKCASPDSPSRRPARRVRRPADSRIRSQ